MLAMLALGALLAATSPAPAADSAVVAQFPFNGDLTDLTGRGTLTFDTPPAFAEGHDGQALDARWHPLTLASRPDLQLAPGLAVDCWVWFDEDPVNYEQIIIKDKEYQIKVDSDMEDGRIAAFVYIDGAWESRLLGPVPVARHWYHVAMSWTGTELRLVVDGELYSTARPGTPVVTDNPVVIGNCSARIDDLIIRNPTMVQWDTMETLQGANAAAARTSRASFGGAAGWDGWQASGGVATQAQGTLRLTSDGAAAMLCRPALDTDTAQARYLSVDIDAPGSDVAMVQYITDAGRGMVMLPLWGPDRTAIADMSTSANWKGHLQLLALSVPGEEARDITLTALHLGARPQGRPTLYFRSLTPARAIFRAGREEQVVAMVRSVAADARNVRAELKLPAGAALLGPASVTAPELPFDGLKRFEWTVRADRPLAGDAAVTLSADGFRPVTQSVALDFRPALDLAVADYVPEPRPVHSKSLLLMHYCPLWKFGTHYGWGKIEPYPERRPAIGWYDEGTPEVADWHIKMASEHGIDAFIYCWYRSNWGPNVTHSIGHAVEAMRVAKYNDRFKFTIMWENGCALGVQSREDMRDNLMPYWMKEYFKHPSYLLVDNKPVLFVWRPERVAGEVGGSEQVRGMFDDMREDCRKEGFDGLIIIGCVDAPNRDLQERMAKEGWDATSAYGLFGPVKSPATRDPEGNPVLSHAESMAGQIETWRGKKEIGALPDIVDSMVGWDPRPWNNGRASYYGGQTVEAFRATLQNASDLIGATPGNGLDKRMMVFDNWNEFGEGHYIEPNAGFGFGFLDAIREVFCPDAGPHEDITPEDVGLPLPQRVYDTYGRLMSPDVTVSRPVTGNLLGWWRFDDTDETIAVDASACQFQGFKQRFQATEGKHGGGFLCTGGAVQVGNHPMFFPTTGLTLEAWVKPRVPDQGDRWIVNTVGNGSNGYRLGLGGGRPVFQVPVTEWSHNLTGPEPLPVDEWSHLVATYDNDLMRIYVNGTLVASMPRGGPIAPSGAALLIGNYLPDHATAYFDGVLDELRVYDRALTDAEVRGRFELGGAE